MGCSLYLYLGQRREPFIIAFGDIADLDAPGVHAAATLGRIAPHVGLAVPVLEAAKSWAEYERHTFVQRLADGRGTETFVVAEAALAEEVHFGEDG
jgi:hypothetical protein